jgi:hypothetical protein
LARSRSIIALLALVAGAALPAAAASASPPTPSTLTFHFMACTWPAGTPEAFDAVKQPGGAAALRLISGSGVFVVIEAIDVATGDLLFTTPGFAHNGLTTVSCSVVNPTTGQEQLVTGLLVARR